MRELVALLKFRPCYCAGVFVLCLFFALPRFLAWTVSLAFTVHTHNTNSTLRKHDYVDLVLLKTTL